MFSLFALIGRRSLALAEFLGGASRTLYRSTYWIIVGPFSGKGLRWQASVRQMVIVGFDAVPIVMLISSFIGVIVALQGAYALRKFGAIHYVVDMVAVTVTRELGPLLTAIIVIGRSGSSFAAEIGTMKVGEEVDALETMGLNPIRFLVVPRYVAMLIMLPCLTTIADNRPQLKKDLEALELTLTDARKLMSDIAAALEANRSDLDTMLENLRRSSENLREFTDTIKQQPYSLVRIKAKPERRVPK